MGWAGDPYGGEYSCTQGFGETDHLEHLRVDGGGGNIKMDFQETGWGRGVDLSVRAQHTGTWRPLENAVMNLQIS